ncbi:MULTISPECIES: hypothetical protein [unclassified Moorena]|uniref:hypothetical protein n=1 Tax=unclassified Moorena TaxID=2683338 RepID=UPI0025D67857|nr:MULTISPECIES: hypothetical protein [unclassified Moorena]
MPNRRVGSGKLPKLARLVKSSLATAHQGARKYFFTLFFTLSVKNRRVGSGKLPKLARLVKSSLATAHQGARKYFFTLFFTLSVKLASDAIALYFRMHLIKAV